MVIIQGGAPQKVLNWFNKPINYRYIMIYHQQKP